MSLEWEVTHKWSDKGRDLLCLRLNTSSRTVNTRPLHQKLNELILRAQMSAVSYRVRVRDVSQNRKKTLYDACGLTHKHHVSSWMCDFLVRNTWAWPQKQHQLWRHANTHTRGCTALSLCSSRKAGQAVRPQTLVDAKITKITRAQFHCSISYSDICPSRTSTGVRIIIHAGCSSWCCWLAVLIARLTGTREQNTALVSIFCNTWGFPVIYNDLVHPRRCFFPHFSAWLDQFSALNGNFWIRFDWQPPSPSCSCCCSCSTTQTLFVHLVSWFQSNTQMSCWLVRMVHSMQPVALLLQPHLVLCGNEV